MLWRTIKQEHETTGKKQLPKKLSGDKLGDGDANFRVASPRGVREVASRSHDTHAGSDKPHRQPSSSIEATMSFDVQDAGGFQKPATPKSVSFAISDWKYFSVSGIAESTMSAMSGLLNEQKEVFGIDMFTELGNDDQTESEFLQKYGYSFEETALVIFNRRRQLVIPAPGELQRITVSYRMDAARNGKFAAERSRRHQFTLATLSEEEQMCLTLLLSEQEEQFGTNMFDSVTDDDEAEVSGLLAQGYKYDDITHMIFQRKYDPSKPVDLIHPMQQGRSQPHSSFLNASFHNHSDNSSVQSNSACSFSMNSLSLASLNSAPSQNLFQPMAGQMHFRSPMAVNQTSSKPSFFTHDAATFSSNQSLATNTNQSFRMPSTSTGNLFSPTTAAVHASSSNLTSNGSVVSQGTEGEATTQATLFRMPMSVPTPGLSKTSSPNTSMQVNPGQFSAGYQNNHNNNNHYNPGHHHLHKSSPPTGFTSSNGSVVSHGSMSATSVGSATAVGGTGGTAGYGNGNGNVNGNGRASSSSSASSVASSSVMTSSSVTSPKRSVSDLKNDISSADAEALAVKILAQRASLTAKLSSNDLHQQQHHQQSQQNLTASSSSSPTNNSFNNNNNNNSNNRLFRTMSATMPANHLNPLASPRRSSILLSAKAASTPAAVFAKSAASSSPPSNNNNNNNSDDVTLNL